MERRRYPSDSPLTPGQEHRECHCWLSQHGLSHPVQVPAAREPSSLTLSSSPRPDDARPHPLHTARAGPFHPQAHSRTPSLDPPHPRIPPGSLHLLPLRPSHRAYFDHPCSLPALLFLPRSRQRRRLKRSKPPSRLRLRALCAPDYRRVEWNHRRACEADSGGCQRGRRRAGHEGQELGQEALQRVQERQASGRLVHPVRPQPEAQAGAFVPAFEGLRLPW